MPGGGLLEHVAGTRSWVTIVSYQYRSTLEE